MEADPGDKAGIGSDFEDKRAIYSRYRSNFSMRNVVFDNWNIARN